MRRANPDVLVVGLGPAGSRAAEHAARAGLRVVAVDRKQAAGMPVQCAEFVPAMLEHEIAGLARVTAQPVRRMLSFVEAEPPDVEPNLPGRMIDRAAFDRLLARRAALAGADCRFGVGVRHIGADGAVALGDGTVLRPRLLIGADGPRSRVGRAIGRSNRALVETRQIAVPLLAPHDATDIFLRAAFEGGYGWLFPRGGRANLGLGVTPPARRRLRPLLEALHAELAEAGRVGREILDSTGGPIPVGGRVEAHGRLGQTGVLLAGDAAGLTNPVTGAGIAAAVLSGALAGAAAAAWLDQDEMALTDYDDELEALFGASLRRALARRRELVEAYRFERRPSPRQMRRAWVAYPDYWAA